MNMKYILLIAIACLALPTFGQQNYYDLNAGNGYGVRFWGGNDGFKISMGNSSEYQFGPVSSFSIRSTMDNLTGRGWTWGLAGSTTNVASLSIDGHMQLAGTFKSKALSVGPTLYDYAGTGDLGAIEFPRGELLYATSNTQNQLYLSSNAYYYPGGFRYRNTGPAAGLGVDGGAILLWTAPSNSANSSVSFSPKMTITNDGKVGIGTGSPDQLLTVNGIVHATRVKVDTTVPTPDYVFEKSYSLPSLDEVKSYIDENKHLPEVPSAREMEAKGIDVGEMNMLLLKKVEELTLYVIALKQEVNELKKK